MPLDRSRRVALPLLIAALIAVTGLAFLEWLPHSHAGASAERPCAICQVARESGADTPPDPAAPCPALLAERAADDPAPDAPATSDLVDGTAPRAPPAAHLS
ncbi:MAG: hypothetical protein EDX89_06025 [Acidobacteria bacterium]|nr:MAG: hypothetical protein EDX89_06025 [Acidobacteriota bacterium]MCE7959603.1 hypothetical protein [Acidobacteria bacterium ACB2]